MKRVNTIHKYCFSIVLLLNLHGLTACNQNNEPSGAEQVSTTADTTTFDLGENVGWVHGNCLAIKKALMPDTRLTLVLLNSTQKTMTVNTVKEAKTSAHCYALFDDRRAINQAEDRHFYLLDKRTAGTDFVAIGLVTEEAEIIVKNDTVQSDLNGDGKQEAYSSCETHEGMNFYIWPEQAYQGEPLWMGYYYLGYDLTPTCPE
jgi:hypothetical protein